MLMATAIAMLVIVATPKQEKYAFRKTRGQQQQEARST